MYITELRILVVAKTLRLVPRLGSGSSWTDDRKRTEKIMLEFMNHDYDILVATTIIETYIDIQNVNTMIIYDG